MQLGDKISGTHRLARIVGQYPETYDYAGPGDGPGITEHYGRSHVLHKTGWHYPPFDGWLRFKVPTNTGDGVVSWWLRPLPFEGIVVAKTRASSGERVEGYQSGYYEPEWQEPYFMVDETFPVLFVATNLGPTTQFVMAPAESEES